MYPVVRRALFCAGLYAGKPVGQSGQLVCVCVCVCVSVCDQWVETGLSTSAGGSRVLREGNYRDTEGTVSFRCYGTTPQHTCVWVK